MSTGTKAPESELVRAASRLEEELGRYERLTLEAQKMGIHSEKSLLKASQTLRDATLAHQRILEHVGALSAAMNATRKRQETCAEGLLEVGRRIEERANAYQTLVQRYAAVGELSKGLNASATDVLAAQKVPERQEEARAGMAALQVQLGDAITSADEVARAAREAEFPDVGRDADALKQQMLTAKNRLTLAQRSMAERAPS